MGGFEVTVGLSVLKKFSSLELCTQSNITLWARMGNEELSSANVEGLQGLLHAETSTSSIKRRPWEHNSVFRCIRELGHFHLCWV